MHENGCFEETELQALDPQQTTKDAETITENTVRGKLSQSFGGKKSQVKTQDEVRRVFILIMYILCFSRNYVSVFCIA